VIAIRRTRYSSASVLQRLSYKASSLRRVELKERDLAMAKPRKATAPRKRGAAKGWTRLVEEIEKLAAALERDATHKLAHCFGDLGSGLSELVLSWEKSK
jgi:hypothetical protein